MEEKQKIEEIHDRMMKNKIIERLNMKEMDSKIHDELNMLDEVNLKIRKFKSKLMKKIFLNELMKH